MRGIKLVDEQVRQRRDHAGHLARNLRQARPDTQIAQIAQCGHGVDLEIIRFLEIGQQFEERGLADRQPAVTDDLDHRRAQVARERPVADDRLDLRRQHRVGQTGERVLVGFDPEVPAGPRARDQPRKESALVVERQRAGVTVA
jgi:hypothetical protein